MPFEASSELNGPLISDHRRLVALIYLYSKLSAWPLLLIVVHELQLLQRLHKVFIKVPGWMFRSVSLHFKAWTRGWNQNGRRRVLCMLWLLPAPEAAGGAVLSSCGDRISLRSPWRHRVSRGPSGGPKYRPSGYSEPCSALRALTATTTATITATITALYLLLLNLLHLVCVPLLKLHCIYCYCYYYCCTQCF